MEITTAIDPVKEEDRFKEIFKNYNLDNTEMRYLEIKLQYPDKNLEWVNTQLLNKSAKNNYFIQVTTRKHVRDCLNEINKEIRASNIVTMEALRSQAQVVAFQEGISLMQTSKDEDIKTKLIEHFTPMRQVVESINKFGDDDDFDVPYDEEVESDKQ